MTITLSSKEVALLIADRATRVEANADTWPNDAKKYANRVRELLDLYDEAFAREKAEFEKAATERAARLGQSGS